MFILTVSVLDPLSLSLSLSLLYFFESHHDKWFMWTANVVVSIQTMSPGADKTLRMNKGCRREDLPGAMDDWWKRESAARLDDDDDDDDF